MFELSASQTGQRVDAAAKAAGLGEGFSGHSGRVGMAQDLAAAGVELPALMNAGRWKSSRMPAKYTERQAAGRGAVARYYQRRGVEFNHLSLSWQQEEELSGREVQHYPVNCSVGRSIPPR